jgi:hypothetical protein
MIDFLIALPVFIAVTIFGALIVVGNERQKRELAGLRKVAAMWAEQDLRQKRGKLTRDTKIDDPVAWLSAVASKAVDVPVILTAKELLSHPEAVSFLDSESGQKMIFTLLPPDHIKKLSRKRHNSKANRLSAVHPLLSVHREMDVVELNILNGGLLLDLELPAAWQGLTGQTTNADRLWMYMV